ncbi:hypothetical protein Rxyl_1879 [Rubrobacter xylanophilus DSM 9941]|uniref:Uncharacterized protein n=1 Tax=Rubrobacter xylanophilus (strain DSM 9941 / JCM 11954 / NBRC 16129 / PRD-1) TaxID=266117 RepID=Q1AUU9_RUBXD|nr:hypothetical protein Rxyl_1879 [Rubrobacter xylanophilus DSM 9941]
MCTPILSTNTRATLGSTSADAITRQAVFITNPSRSLWRLSAPSFACGTDPSYGMAHMVKRLTETPLNMVSTTYSQCSRRVTNGRSPFERSSSRSLRLYPLIHLGSFTRCLTSGSRDSPLWALAT